MASQLNSLTIVYSAVYSGADQRKHQSSASLTFVRGLHRWPVNSPRKESVTRKIFPPDDVIMWWSSSGSSQKCLCEVLISRCKKGAYATVCGKISKRLITGCVLKKMCVIGLGIKGAVKTACTFFGVIICISNWYDFWVHFEYKYGLLMCENSH